MRIYRFETRRQLVNTLVWMFVISGVLLLMLYGFYPIFLDGRETMEKMLASFPPEVAAAFGFNLDDMFGFQSFSAMVYLYEGIIGGIMAASAAIAVFAREKQNKCTDFLLTKPLHRSQVFFQKLLCCLTAIAVVNIPYIAVFIAGYFDYTADSSITAKLMLSVLSLLFTQLVFVAFGIFAAVFLKRIRSASGLGTGIGMFAFLMSVVYSLTEKEYFKFVSPLYYFSPAVVTETGGYDIPSVITAVVLALTLTAAAYVRYTKSDIAA